MNKEEILRRAREDNHNGDEREEKIRLRSCAISGALGILLCMVLVLAEEVLLNRNATAIWIVYFGMQFIKYFRDAQKLKYKTDITLSILIGLCFVINVVIYIWDILG